MANKNIGPSSNKWAMTRQEIDEAIDAMHSLNLDNQQDQDCMPYIPNHKDVREIPGVPMFITHRNRSSSFIYNSDHKYSCNWTTHESSIYFNIIDELTQRGVSVDDRTRTDVVDIINDYAEKCDPKQFRVKVVPMYTFDDQMKPTFCGWSTQIINHYGQHSINASGMLNSDICDLDIVAVEEQSQLCTYIADVLRTHRDQIFEQNLSIVVQSNLYSQQTAVALSTPVTVNGTFSTCYNRHFVVLPKLFTLKQSFIISRVKSGDLVRYYKMTTFNNQQLEHYTQTIHPFNVAEVNILRTVTSHCLETGTSISDNTYVYYKLWLNIYAKARLEQLNWVPNLPIINDNNTGLVFVVTNGAAPAANFTAANLMDWARRQFFAFYCRRHADQGFLNMLEILGYEGMFFVPDDQQQTVPWKSFNLPAINIVYFSDAVIVHAAQDMTANELLTQTMRLADYRGEGEDFVKGMHMAIEMMGGSLHRHQRLAQQVPGPHPRAQVYADAYAAGANPPLILYGGVPPNAPVYAAPNDRQFTARSDPEGQQFIGDVAVGNAAHYYRNADWEFVHLDALNQVAAPQFYTPLGTNWFLEMLSHKPRQDPTPPIFTVLYNYLASDIVQMFTLGFALINSAATATNISFNITGWLI